MSHHFENPNAAEDPRLNVNDLYLFPGPPDHTVMAMTVNPDARLSAPDTLRDEGVYAFRFDTDGDNAEDVTFTFRFERPQHRAGDVHRHVQTYKVRRATDEAARKGLGGTVIAGGQTGEIVTGLGGFKAWVAVAPDLFAGDGAAINKWKSSFYREGRNAPEEFRNHQNSFDKRNVTALVLEVPNHLIGEGVVRAWATTSLYGHAPEIQISRWGWPLFTHIFMWPDAELSKAFNAGSPADDVARFGAHVHGVVEK